MIKTLRILREQ